MNFLENLRRAREAKSPPAPSGPKAPEEMTPEELDAEIARAEEEVRRAKIRAVEEWRSGQGTSSPLRRPSPFGREPRRPFR